MQVNLATVVAASSAVTGVAAAALAIRLARGPGWGHLRYYALASLGATLFGASDVVMTVFDDPDVVLWASRVNLAAAGIHIGFWLRFFGAWEQRPLGRVERAVSNLGLFGAAAALVPGVFVTGPIRPRTLEWLDITYHDATTTPAGVAFFLLCASATALLFAPAVRLGRAKRSSWSLVTALALMVLAVLNDILSALRVTDWPYLINVAHIALAIGVGITVLTELVESARKLEETSLRLEQARAELVARERLAALGEMAAVVAHEVRNPLAVLFNALAALKHDATSPADGRMLLRMIEDEAERLKRLVDSLLDFVRPYEPKLSVQELRPLVASAAEQAVAKVQCQPGQVTLEVSADPSLPCDRDLLHQAISNLIANALQAPERRGPVRVRLEALPDTTRIAVIDDGRGIPEKHQARLFSPFFTTRATGTGLGLALVKRVADAHRGTVRHEPTPGGGATFVLDLPLRPAQRHA